MSKYTNKEIVDEFLSETGSVDNVTYRFKITKFEVEYAIGVELRRLQALADFVSKDDKPGVLLSTCENLLALVKGEYGYTGNCASKVIAEARRVMEDEK